MIYPDKEKSRVVSRILLYTRGVFSIIYLCGLPPGSGRATLKCRYTWPCNLQARQLPLSPMELVSPYLTFSPLLPPKTGAVIFFPVTVPSQIPSSQKCSALCCPDFPPLAKPGAIEHPALIFNAIKI